MRRWLVIAFGCLATVQAASAEAAQATRRPDTRVTLCAPMADGRAAKLVVVAGQTATFSSESGSAASRRT